MAQIGKIDLFNLALRQQYNGLIFHGHKVGTFMFGVAKLKAIENISKLQGVKSTFDSNRILDRIIHAVYSKVKTILDTEKGRNFVSKFVKVPSIFYPIYYHEIDGHKLVMWEGEPDISIYNILKEYRDLKEWEPETTKMIHELCKDKVCLDIGASIGPLTLQMCRVAEKVIAVEPTDRCFKYLCQNLEANGYKNCIPLRAAAWDKNEIVRMPMNDPHPHYTNGLCMDDWLEKEGILKVDFIKIDVDGAEPRALQGLVRTFERNPQLKMIIEYYPLYILGGGQDPKVFIDILDKYFNCKIVGDDFGQDCWNLICERK